MIKRIDFVIDTELTDEEIKNIVGYELGEVFLYNIGILKAENKEEAIEEMVRL